LHQGNEEEWVGGGYFSPPVRRQWASCEGARKWPVCVPAEVRKRQARAVLARKWAGLIGIALARACTGAVPVRSGSERKLEVTPYWGLRLFSLVTYGLLPSCKMESVGVAFEELILCWNTRHIGSAIPRVFPNRSRG